MTVPFTQHQTRRFLLDQLSDDERELVERHLLADETRYETLLAAEEELIDDFIHGSLDPAERSRFESVAAQRPALRTRIDLAIATRRAARRWRRPEALEPAPEPARAYPTGVRVWFPAAAALVLAIGGLLTSTIASRGVTDVSLSTTLTRATDITPRVPLTPLVEEVRFTIDVETDADAVDVTLVGPTGSVVAVYSAIPVTGELPVRQVRVAVRPDLLVSGLHDLTLSSPKLPPDRRDLAYVSFVVVRR